jgi:hypothetical protein
MHFADRECTDVPRRQGPDFVRSAYSLEKMIVTLSDIFSGSH